MPAVVSKGRYRITNWSQYNESLVKRGSLTLWFDEGVLAEWEHDNAESKVGHPFVYSDRAIETMLMVREVFRLPYRQTEGLTRSLLSLMQADVSVPDFTSLAKRAAKLPVALPTLPSKGAVDVVVDSTGLKVFGEGEWKVRKHGASKRRTWRKLHLCIDPTTREILAETLTENSGTDADQVSTLLTPVKRPIKSFTGDGAYDQWKVYDQLAERGIEARIPPQRNAKIKRHGNLATAPLPRDEAIREIRRTSRKCWKQRIHYHQRSLAETTMFRYKTAFGAELKNRELKNQRTEARLRCKILNRFTKLGIPRYK